MFSEPQQAYLKQIATTTQIIALALIVGVVAFGGIILFLELGPKEPVETLFISIFAVGIGIASVFIAPVISRMIVTGMRRSIMAGKSIRMASASAISEEAGVVGKLAHVYQTQQIISRAVLEGAVFMNLVAYTVEGHPISLVVAVMALIAMFFRFPTQGYLGKWVREEMTTIDQLQDIEGPSRHA